MPSINLPLSMDFLFGARTCTSDMACEHGEPQETCSYHPPCTWASPCQSQLDGCKCPEPYGGVDTSVLPPFVEAGYAGFALLWLPPLLVVICRYSRKRPKSVFPPQLKLSSGLRLWLAACVVFTAALALIANFAPADFWGECRHEICVYHAMFCEPTRHASIVRHPSNFWSNLPYVYTSFYLLILLYGERSSGSARAFQLLDALFAVVLFSLAGVEVSHLCARASLQGLAGRPSPATRAIAQRGSLSRDSCAQSSAVTGVEPRALLEYR